MKVNQLNRYLKIIAVLTTTIMGWSIGSAVVAQEVYPLRPIDVVTHTSPGGGTDATARAVLRGTRQALDTNTVSYTHLTLPTTPYV